MRLGQVLEVGVRILRRHWAVLLGVAVLLVGPAALLTAATGARFNEVVVDISELEMNDAVRVADIPLPSGVRTEVDPEEAVAVGTVTRSTMESMAEEAAGEVEEGEAEEGADDSVDAGDGDDES